jgi:beta-N-acetylhexosaminidase
LSKLDTYLHRAALLRAKLSLNNEVAQVLLVSINGTGRPDASAVELLEHHAVGGILLFGFNVPEKARDLGFFTARIQEAAQKNGTGLPEIIAMDDEGGTVFRFHGQDITRLPSPALASRRGPNFIKFLGDASGSELHALGVNVALAPVVEALNATNRHFLGTRSYGSDPATVDADAGAFIEGLQSQGVAAVAKHFPGNTDADPHRGLAVLSVSKSVETDLFLPRFASAIDLNAKNPNRSVALVMLSHVIVPSLDPSHPASLSPVFIQGQLRQKLGFQGVAVTDDLCMKALTDLLPPTKSAVEALRAGDDLLMISDQGSFLEIQNAIVRAVKSGELERSRLDEAVDRVIALKLRFDMESALDARVRERRLARFESLVAQHRQELQRWGTR